MRKTIARGMASTALFNLVIMPKPMQRARRINPARSLFRIHFRLSRMIRHIKRMVSISLFTLPAMTMVAG